MTEETKEVPLPITVAVGHNLLMHYSPEISRNLRSYSISCTNYSTDQLSSSNAASFFYVFFLLSSNERKKKSQRTRYIRTVFFFFLSSFCLDRQENSDLLLLAPKKDVGLRTFAKFGVR